MTQLIDGKLVAHEIRQQLKMSLNALQQNDPLFRPHLAVILVGNNPASETYVRMKHRACEECGFQSTEIRLPSDVMEVTLLEAIDSLNQDDSVHGILIQLPLPAHIDTEKVLNRVMPAKDVDGFHPLNVGQLSINQEGFVPCTPNGVMALLNYYHIDLEGKHVVIVGRSQIVGKPLAQLFLAQNATVTICHSKTRELATYTQQADIVVAAVGQPQLITAEMIKEGAIVIDVGTNRLSDGRLVGDVDFDNVAKKTSYITPVPGGVGPMTITMLLSNTLKAACTLTSPR